MFTITGSCGEFLNAFKTVQKYINEEEN